MLARNQAKLNSGQEPANSRKATEITWSTRLTIILVGILLLFSAFFTLEFLVTKLVANYPTTATTSALANEHAPFAAPLWPQCLAYDYQHNDPLIGAAHEKNKTNSKLGVDFELIYEQDLELNSRGTHFKRFGSTANDDEDDELLVKWELKLDQLLRAYHVAMPFNPDIWRNSDPSSQLHLLSGNARQCHTKLAQLIEQINLRVNNSDPTPPLHRVGIQQYNLMRLLDAQGRPEAGTLLGHPFWLGSYAQCQRLGASNSRHQNLLELTDGSQLETRYCVAKLTFKSWLTRYESLACSSTQSKASSQLPFSSLKVGLCLPIECDSLELFKAAHREEEENLKTVENAIKPLVKQLIEFNLNHLIYPSQSLQLVDVFCLPLSNKRQLNFAAHLLMGLICGWLLLIILCTYLRHNTMLVTRSRIPAEFIDIMALDTNLIQFFTIKPRVHNDNDDKQLINLSVLDSVKHTGSACVILAHVLLGYLTLGSAYSHTIETLGRDMRTLMLLSLNNIVDTFFVISGLLASYLTLRSMSQSSETAGKKQSSVNYNDYLAIALRRYLRMAPLYLVVYGFIKTLSVHLGEGPLWDYATNEYSMRGSCAQESWWWALTMSSDFKPITQHCIPAAWSLAVDMQFFLLALPLFISGLSPRRHWRVNQLTCAIISLLICASTALTWHEYKSILDYVSKRDFAKLRLHVFTVLIRYAAHAYSQPQNRMGPLLIGLLGGYLLFRYERAGGSGTGWSRWLRNRKLFTCALITCVITLLAPCLVELRGRLRSSLVDAGESQVQWPIVSKLLALNSSLQSDFNFALGGFVVIKPIWSACNLIILLHLITANLNNSLVARLMSGHFWQVISKLNYALLLVHFEVIAYELMSRHSHSDQPITWIYLANKFAYTYLYSLIVVAFPLCVLFEQPSHRLITWLLWGGDGGGRRSSVNLRKKLRQMQATTTASN